MGSNAQTAYAETASDANDVNRLVEEHLDYVRRIVGQLPSAIRNKASVDDLVGAGMVGLVEAAHRYEDNRGASFTTFAYRRIKGAVMDYLRRNDYLSKSARKRLSAIREEIRRFKADNGRSPSVAELADSLDLSEEAVLNSLAHEKWSSVSSLGRPISDSEGSETSLSAFIPADISTPLEKAEKRDRVDLLTEAIESLSERQQQLIVMYYYEELYMSEIAEVLGLSEGRVSQLHTKAIYALGRYMEDEA